MNALLLAIFLSLSLGAYPAEAQVLSSKAAKGGADVAATSTPVLSQVDAQRRGVRLCNASDTRVWFAWGEAAAVGSGFFLEPSSCDTYTQLVSTQTLNAVHGATGTKRVAAGGSHNYGESVIRVDPAAGSIGDWFTPFDWAARSAADMDLAGGTVLIPGTRLGVFGSKDGKIYVLNLDALGHFRSDSDSQVVQSWTNGGGGLFTPFAYFNGYLYVSAFDLRAHALSGGIFNTNVGNLRRNSAWVSANGTADAIVWVSSNTAESRPLVSAIRVSDHTIIWQSNQAAGSRDVPTKRGVSWSGPVPFNGRVYLGGHQQVTCWGRL